MTEDEDYEEYDAVIRVPKGERLVDSKESEGWNLGFTPKTTEKGPEFVKIRLKGEADDTESDPMPDEPRYSYSYDSSEPQHQKSPEQEELEELLAALIILGIIKAAEWAQPRLRRLWEERVIPFLNEPRRRWQERRAQRKAHEQPAAEAPDPVRSSLPVEETSEVSNALEAYKVNMSSSEARRHFTEALVAQRFVNAKMRLLADARIEDAHINELANAVQSLTPEQVGGVLDSILASNPSLIDDLGMLINAARDDGGLQLASGGMRAALRLTDGR